MIRLNKFYDLVSGYARILLVNEDGSKEYFCGDLRHIPDKYDECEVVNFSMSYDGTITFQLKEVVE